MSNGKNNGRNNAQNPDEPDDGAQGKKARRDAAREKARLQREAERKRKLRNRRITQGVVIVAILAVLAVVGVVIFNGVGGAQASAAGPKNMISDGILLTGNGKTITATRTAGLKAGEKPVPTDVNAHSKTVNIVTYIDYQCPYCDEFETTNETQMMEWVTAGVATLEIHPIAILDSSSDGTDYSTRSANAAACVANYEPDKYLAVNKVFYANQPKEGTTGLTNAKLVSLVKKAGADNAKIPACINGETFRTWVGDATSRALKGPLPNSNVKAVTGTPTVIIDGTQYNGSLTSASDFSNAVEAAYEKKVGSN
jgi:protein-disulfide isomerase